jgi:Fic family protein
MTCNPSHPYNDLPPLPPKGILESIQILKACIPARTALAELKQAGELLPNQGLLINALPLLEAKDSSEIENIVTTTDKLFNLLKKVPMRILLLKKHYNIEQHYIRDLLH